MKRYIIYFSFLVSLFMSCTNSAFIKNHENNEYGSLVKTKLDFIATRTELAVNQHSMMFGNLSPSRVVQSSENLTSPSLTENDICELKKFTTSPFEYLYKNVNSDDADDKNLTLIHSIYSESTVDDVIKNMECVNSEMANDYKNSISDFYENMNPSTRALIAEHGGMEVRRLYILDDDAFLQSRSISFATDLSWESVSRYVGYGVASIAGAICFKYGFLPWIRYPGLAVCLSGIGCMGVLIARWMESPRLSVISDSVKYMIRVATETRNKRELSDLEKCGVFLSAVERKLKDNLRKNPSSEAEIKNILNFINEKRLIDKTFENVCNTLIGYCLNYDQTAIKLGTIGATTASVAISCWFTGVVATLKEAFSILSSFILA